jgi:vanillate O-demethylase ferredoxin subunit
MVRWCHANKRSWSLLYCTRSRQRTAFYEELKAFGCPVRLHFDEEAGGPVDLASALAHPLRDEHVYCCGPKPLMLAVQNQCAGRDPDSVHFEWFSAKEVAHDAGASRPFTVVLRQSGLTLEVPCDRSILETMEDHGLSVPFSCREGLCRTCETGLRAGEADHRDHVLSDAERGAQKSMLICVSRARSRTLELDA